MDGQHRRPPGPQRGPQPARPCRRLVLRHLGQPHRLGQRVWSVLDDQPDGAAQRFPIYSTSRREAGGSIAGGVWKCQLQSVSKALHHEVYGDWTPTDAEQARLERSSPTAA